jgi:predicted nucleic acid-binding protein
LTGIAGGIVIDASVALAWCFPDEASNYADAVLVAVEDRTLIVPAVWSLEITNALLVGERRKRIRQPEVGRFVELLKGLSIYEDGQRFADTVGNVLPLAREYDRSAYDAAYLDVAVRHGRPLATLDATLQKAARAARIEIFGV